MVGLYGFIHPYSRLTIASVTTCNSRVKVSIIPFTMCHMATQKLLNIITNAIIGPWHATFVINSSTVKVCN
jgi:predicted membrane protein